MARPWRTGFADAAYHVMMMMMEEEE